jgi:nitroreductase
MDFMEVLRRRRSIRKYKPDPVPDELIEQVLEAARLSPSGKNMQPYHFVVVKERETKKKIDPRLAEVPVIIVGLVDPTKGRCSIPDGILAFEHIILGAVNAGLGSCWKGTYLGHLQEHEQEIKEALDVPEHIAVVAYTPIGYPDESPEMRDKKPLNEIVHYDKW